VFVHARSPPEPNFRLSKFRGRSTRSSKPDFDRAALYDRLHRNTAGKRQPFSSAMSVWSNLFLMPTGKNFPERVFRKYTSAHLQQLFSQTGRARAPLDAALRRYRRCRITEQRVESRWNFRVEMSRQKRRLCMKYFSTVWRLRLLSHCRLQVLTRALSLSRYRRVKIFARKVRVALASKALRYRADTRLSHDFCRQLQSGQKILTGV
jgi:hypothetical protein